MSDATLPHDVTDRNLLFGVLALQLDFLTRAQLRDALRDWAGHTVYPLGQILVERNALTPHRRALLDDVVREYLTHHEMDPSKGLAAACAARAVPVDASSLFGPAQRQGMATVVSSSGTLAGANRTPTAPPPAVGGLANRRFRILHPHARGALGEVFVAHDEELNREVALKEIQAPYAHHADSRARFVLEAEITGSLEHPGIVPVYSLGTHHDGRPYYAMRFIKGESLHDAIWRFHQPDPFANDPSERALQLRSLLTRFLGVCHAVAYAHSRGVIHRDIKPSNIMLGPYGETLVVDWGLAKAFNQPMTEDSIELPLHPVSSASTEATMLGQAVGTPAFMPPEQASGRVDQVGPASDIYSLGATLYQMVTGRLAFTGSASDVMRQVKTHQFPPPRKVNRQVPAALEAIVLKAMAFHPDDRYASVDDLGRDVERWLADEKVQAYQETMVERGKRWIRNHQPYVYAATALLLTTMLGLGVVLWAVNLEQKRTAEERDNANHNLKLAKKAVDECFQLAKEAPLLQQDRMQDVRKLLLEKALPFYEQFRIQKPDDEGIHYEIGRNHFRVGFITEAIGKKAKAIESYELAREVFVGLSREDPNNDDLRSDLAQTTNNLGVLQRDTGQRTQALASLEQARKVNEELVRKHKGSVEYLSDLADTCNNLGVLHRDLKKPREALECYEQARDIFRQLTHEKPEAERYQAGLAAAYHNIGRLQADNDEPEEALKAYEQARKILDNLVAKYPDSTRHRSALASALLNLGGLVHAEPGQRAKVCYERALELCEALVKERSQVAGFQADLARACDRFGALLAHAGEINKAVPLQKRAVKILEALVKQHEEETDYRLDLAGSCINLAHAYRDDSQTALALLWYEKAFLQIREVEEKAPGLPETRSYLRNAHKGRGDTLVKQGEHRRAVVDYRKAVALTRPGDRNLVEIRVGLGIALANAGEHRRAMAEIVELLRDKGEQGEPLYGAACIASLAAKAAAKDAMLPEGQREKLAEGNARQAVDYLERARLAKFFRDKSRIDHLKNDEDLKYLEGRQDYRRFLDQLNPGK